MRFFLFAGIGTGAVMALLALVDIVRIKIMPSEKAAYFFLGHWFDAFWQIQLPALILGLVMVVCGIQLLPDDRR